MSVQRQYYPTKSIEAQNPLTSDPSGASQAVYCVLENVDDGLARLMTGFKTYMQQDVTDPNRPDGHLTLHFQYSHNLTWTPNMSKIADLQQFKAPNPTKFAWWRSCFPNKSDLMKRRTFQLGATTAKTGDLILFQNSPVDGAGSPP